MGANKILQLFYYDPILGIDIAYNDHNMHNHGAKARLVTSTFTPMSPCKIVRDCKKTSQLTLLLTKAINRWESGRGFNMALTSYKLPLHRMRVCQCSVCGEYFSSLRSFDKHRTGPMDGKRSCQLRIGGDGYRHILTEDLNGTYWRWAS